MTSKEKIEVLRKLQGCGIRHYKLALEEIKKDLEDYEELKKIMGTPIQDIMKRLKVLEILKKHYRFNQNINEDLLVLKKPITIEDSEKIKEWLNDK